MAFNAAEFIETLTDKLDTFDDSAVADLITGLVDNLYSTPSILNVRQGETILMLLRNQRKFDLIQKSVEVFIQSGLQSSRISRMYAQSLIDLGNYTSALSILNSLAQTFSNTLVDTDQSKSEYSEVQGLLGRTYKEMFLKSKTDPSGIIFIKKSIGFYHSVYVIAPQSYLWHGINAVALLCRADREAVPVDEFPDPFVLAYSILGCVQQRYDKDEADAWDFATAAEACIALNRPKEALKWLSGYVRMPYNNAFELSNTLRQFEEVWQLDLRSQIGQYLLPLLRSELIQRTGATLTLDIQEIRNQSAIESIVDDNYISLIDNENKITEATGEQRLEKIFGSESFKTYKWYMTGANRCLAIARIGRTKAYGLGVGFLVLGVQLHKKLDDEFCLITCRHVVGEGDKNSLAPHEAVIVFEALSDQEEFRVSEIIWSSPVKDLDTTILRFHPESSTRLKQLAADLRHYPLAKELPLDRMSKSGRFYVIGHPRGSAMRISFADNTLLDIDAERIHYGRPSEWSGSGSPIFNENWELIGIQHSGSKRMARLHGKEGTYEANEGILISAIKAKLSETLNTEFESYSIEDYNKKGNSYELAQLFEEALKTYADGYEAFPDEYEFLKKRADVFTKKGDIIQFLESLARYNKEKNRITLDKNLKEDFIGTYLKIENHPFYGNLTWPLNNKVNILLGKNGYGKSHLLTIMLSLLQNDIQKTREFAPSGAKLSILLDKRGVSSSVDPQNLDEQGLEELKNTITYSDTGLDSVLGKVPVLAIPDARFIDKSANFVSRSPEDIDALRDAAFHFLYQKPYAGIIESALYRTCQIYSERLDKNEKLSAIGLIEAIFHKLTGDHFELKKIESKPNTDYEVLVSTEGSESLPIQKVSQGTFSIITIILIIFNYLKARYPDVDDETITTQHAIVFIDEIDAHLHPSWQQKVINILRETFPSVQFFITGHSPLLVAGCRLGEVAVLRKSSSGFELDFFKHDFVGYEVSELYKQVFEIESYDETYLKYNSLLPFKEDYEKEIENLKAIEQKSDDEIRKLDQLYTDLYYMNVVAQKNELQTLNESGV